MTLDLEAGEISVGEIMGSMLFTAKENDGMRETLELMRHKGRAARADRQHGRPSDRHRCGDDIIRALAEDIGTLASIAAREQAREAAQRKALSV